MREFLYRTKLKRRPHFSELTHKTYCAGAYITKEAVESVKDK